MDTTETFIKMRLSAIPDLGRGVPYADTFCALSNLRHFVDRKGDFYVWMQEEPTWCQLERQDQLQAMMGFYSKEALLHNFYEFLHTPVYNVINWVLSTYTSMEQLWLAFVMKEKHNKVWNDKEWVLSQVPAGGKDG